MLPAAATVGWSVDWMWGISLIALSMVTHAAGLALIVHQPCPGVRFDGRDRRACPSTLHRVLRRAVGATSVLLALLHGLEASYWAATYVWLGAAPDFRRSIYFSLQMVTTLGADVVQLEDRWKLMGPLEAISGMLLFGLSTAFLFAIMQRVWPFPQSMRAATPPDQP